MVIFENNIVFTKTVWLCSSYGIFGFGFHPYLNERPPVLSWRSRVVMRIVFQKIIIRPPLVQDCTNNSNKGLTSFTPPHEASRYTCRIYLSTRLWKWRKLLYYLNMATSISMSKMRLNISYFLSLLT